MFSKENIPLNIRLQGSMHENEVPHRMFASDGLETRRKETLQLKIYAFWGDYLDGFGLPILTACGCEVFGL